MTVLFRSNFKGQLVKAYFNDKLVFLARITTDPSVNAAAGFDLPQIRGKLKLCIPERDICKEIPIDPKNEKVVEVFLDKKGIDIIQTSNFILLD